MAQNGFKVFDSDMHIMEPADLWERHIAPEFRSVAPHGRTSENVRDLGMIFPNIPPSAKRTAGTPHRGHNFEKNQELYRDHAQRGWSPEVQLEAMDTEGIDVAVLFPTRGLGILTYPDQDPRFAAALASRLQRLAARLLSNPTQPSSRSRHDFYLRHQRRRRRDSSGGG